MDTARIAALLEPFLDQPLPPLVLEQISMYINLLLRWNARINLTAIRDPEQIVTRHFGESFFLARHLFPDRVARTLLSAQGVSSSRKKESVFDLGSGAGFPALPIKLWFPNIHLTLIESNHKKAAFLREVVRTLTLIDVDVIAERAESLVSKAPPPADIVTLRAVELFKTVLPLAVRFLAPAGRIAVLIGTSQLPTLLDLTPTINWVQRMSIPKSHSRLLMIGEHQA